MVEGTGRNHLLEGEVEGCSGLEDSFGGEVYGWVTGRGVWVGGLS